MKKSVWEPLALACAFAVAANAFTLSGKVSDEQGAAVSGASVLLVKNNLSTTTDSKGEFSFHKDLAGVGVMERILPGYISVNNGVLSFSQRSSEPVQVQIFDMMGNRLLNETLYGSGSLDLQACVKAQGAYYARVKIGSAQRDIRFTSKGNYSSSFGEKSASVDRALKRLTTNETLKVIADGFDTLAVLLNNLDTNVSLTMKKPKAEPQYAYGWGLKNDPVPTRGCGKTWNRVKSGSYEFQWSKGKRTIRIDIPDNYDNKKPYKLIFGMHCMGGWAGGVQQEGYYGLKPLDTQKTAIFVAPEGNGNQAPWGQDDYLLFDELLADFLINVYKNGGKKYYKYYYYNSLRECCFERNIEIKDAFCMAMRNRIDNRHIKTLYPKVPISKQEVVFVEDMNIDGIEFENRGAKKKAKQKTKEKIKVNKKEKIKHYRNCPNCGKIIPSGFRLCADCKRIKDENKKKNNLCR